MRSSVRDGALLTGASDVAIVRIFLCPAVPKTHSTNTLGPVPSPHPPAGHFPGIRSLERRTRYFASETDRLTMRRE